MSLRTVMSVTRKIRVLCSTYVNVSETEPIFSGAYQAEKATIAGICNKQTCRAYAEPISILNHLVKYQPQKQKGETYLRAMFPFKANDIAFINSVVLGTRAKRVHPKNFSSIPDPSGTTSTT